MNRVEEANKMMQKLGVKENSLAKSFDEFETVKNNFIYGEGGSKEIWMKN